MKEIKIGNVSRYCKPSHLQDGIVKYYAFLKRRDEESLSVHLLEFFQKETELENVLEVKAYMKNYNFKRNGSFAVINIQKSKQYILEEISSQIYYREETLPHCGIFHDADDILISRLLAECVQNNYLIKDITDSKNGN
ncbi:MAG: hypothetical protein H9536_04215 [Aphanizomenon flos-aquae Clear-A1]|jgi:hypothetical protein|nr:hypothetical protein [Aphanizomenon flos-aquae Clear-A1]